MTEDSEILVSRAAGGDALARSSLYERHLPAFRAFVRLKMGALLRSKESTTDIVQSVFREVLEDVDKFEWQGDGAFRHWLFQRGVGKILNRNRHYKAARRDAVRDGTPVSECYASIYSPSDQVMARDDIEQVERAFDKLPEDYREVILLSRIVGLSRAEVAEKMGRTESAIGTLLSRAVARLAGAVARDNER